MPIMTLFVAMAATAVPTTPVARGPISGPRFSPGVTGFLTNEYDNYSGTGGARRSSTARSEMKLGATRLNLALSDGMRKFDDQKFHARRFEANLSHQFGDHVTTRTIASIAGNSPVYARSQFGQEVSYRFSGATSVTAGFRRSNYFGGINVNSYSLGVSQQVGPARLGYRLSSYSTPGQSRNLGHLFSATVYDGAGLTQLWLGTGDNDRELFGVGRLAGRTSSLELRRTQHIAGPLSVQAGFRKSWLDFGATSYRGTGLQLGLVIGR